MWEKQSVNHPWVKLLLKQDQNSVQNLMKPAIDVYNDSKILTLSANSWSA